MLGLKKRGIIVKFILLVLFLFFGCDKFGNSKFLLTDNIPLNGYYFEENYKLLLTETTVYVNKNTGFKIVEKKYDEFYFLIEKDSSLFKWCYVFKKSKENIGSVIVKKTEDCNILSKWKWLKYTY